MLQVYVQPGARVSGVSGVRDGVLHVKVKEQARRGAANRALIALVADVLGVPKSDVEIVRGFTGRAKVLSVRGLGAQEMRERLAGLAGS